MSSHSIPIANYPGIAANITSLDQCTPSLCSLDYAVVRYIPSALANAAFATVFTALLVTQITAWFQHRTRSLAITMCLGLVLEVLGYLARWEMRNYLFIKGPFLVQIICLTIAPVFFTAALYLTLSRLITHYGTHNSRLSPRAYTITFIGSDVIALLLQSVGGALTDTAADLASATTGTHIMVAGLSFQVASLTVFSLLCAEFFWRVKQDRERVAASNWALGLITRPPPHTTRYKLSLSAFILATILILARSSFRVAELVHGFRSDLANNQVAFMILEGGMMILATFCLTALYPGIYVGQPWKESTRDKDIQGITIL